jgi:polysaccharide export outer membrane protein
MLGAVLVGGCSIVPGTGPTTLAMLDGRGSEAVASETPPAEPYALVTVDRHRARVVNAAFEPENDQIVGAFLPDQAPPPLRIAVGDSVVVAIVSTSETGFLDFSQSAISPISQTVLPAQQVDAKGRIHVPPAGRVRVAGLDEAAVERRLTARLGEILVNPTVIVRVADRAKARAAILGSVAAPGRYSLDPEATRLLDLIGEAGGQSGRPEDLQLTLTRDGVSATLPLSAILANPAYNIRVWPDDVILIEPPRRQFVALGAFGASGRAIDIDRDEYSLAEAMSAAGGLRTSQADRRGVFVFRPSGRELLGELGVEQAALAAQADPVLPTVYHFDMREPMTFFALSEFQLRDGDLVYVSDAPIAEFNKVFNTFLRVSGQAVGYARLISD